MPSVYVPNLKFLASTVPEILGGPKSPKMGHVTLFGLIWQIWDISSRFQFVCHIIVP